MRVQGLSGTGSFARFKRWALPASIAVVASAVVLLARTGTAVESLPAQTCVGSQNPMQGTCNDCMLSYQSGIANGDDCMPCRWAYSWTITCGEHGIFGGQNNSLACGDSVPQIVVPCPSGGNAFTFDFSSSECQ